MLRSFLAILAILAAAALALLARRLRLAWTTRLEAAAPAARRRGSRPSQHQQRTQQRTQQLRSGDTFVHVPKTTLLDDQLGAIAVPGGAVHEHLQARGGPALD